MYYELDAARRRDAQGDHGRPQLVPLLHQPVRDAYAPVRHVAPVSSSDAPDTGPRVSCPRAFACAGLDRQKSQGPREAGSADPLIMLAGHAGPQAARLPSRGGPELMPRPRPGRLLPVLVLLFLLVGCQTSSGAEGALPASGRTLRLFRQGCGRAGLGRLGVPGRLRPGGSDPRFGGLSGLWVAPDGERLIALSDRGTLWLAEPSMPATARWSASPPGRRSSPARRPAILRRATPSRCRCRRRSGDRVRGRASAAPGAARNPRARPPRRRPRAS